MKITLLFAALLSFATPGGAAPLTGTKDAATAMVPAERFDSGVLAVARYGARGRPLILVPGLASGAWAWQSVVRGLAADYTLYVVTLPGFDGRAYTAGTGLDAARAGLQALIAARHLDRPVLVGHSLGAVLGYTLAAQQPQLLGGLVAIDGYPVFPGTEQMPAAGRAAMASATEAQLAAVDQATFARQQQAYMRSIGVMDVAQADRLAQLSGKSDPAAVAHYIADVLALDVRAQLPQIAVPVLVVTPYFDQDPTDAGQAPEAKAAYVRTLVAGLPDVQVLTVPESRHFVMFDQPEVLNGMLRTYLQEHKLTEAKRP